MFSGHVRRSLSTSSPPLVPSYACARRWCFSVLKRLTMRSRYSFVMNSDRRFVVYPTAADCGGSRIFGGGQTGCGRWDQRAKALKSKPRAGWSFSDHWVSSHSHEWGVWGEVGSPAGVRPDPGHLKVFLHYNYSRCRITVRNGCHCLRPPLEAAEVP